MRFSAPVNVNAPVLINAGLGGSRDDAGWVLLTQHNANSRKLSEIYANSEAKPSFDFVPIEFSEKCSRLAYEGVSLVLPFVALTAGALLAGSLYRFRTRGIAAKTFMQIDLLGKQQKFSLR